MHVEEQNHCVSGIWIVNVLDAIIFVTVYESCSQKNNIEKWINRVNSAQFQQRKKIRKPGMVVKTCLLLGNRKDGRLV